MALVIEDGSIVSGANSYATAAEYNAYIDARYSALARSVADAVVEGYLLLAMDYLESQSLIGAKYTDAQPLQWPRSDVYIDGYIVLTTEIPAYVIKALYEVAYGIEQGFSPTAPVSRETLIEKVGEISITYKDSSASRTLLPAASQALSKFTVSSSRTVRV